MNYDKYSFNVASRSFLEALEKDYERKIVIIEKELGPAEHGFAKVIDGTPTIEIAAGESHVEELILHEAYHLRLRFDGMPSIGFALPKGQMTTDNTFYLNWFGHLYWDKISHHFFYPNMATELGVDPYVSFKKELDGVFEINEIKNLKEATKEISLAGHYVQTWVETQDKGYLQRFHELLSSIYSGTGITLGKSLLALFQEKTLKDFEDCVALFTKIFDIVHSPQGIRVLNHETQRESHSNYTQVVTVFLIGA
jgi:hypothetical protein